jgi:two-component system, cell cycle response regulator
MSLSILLVEDNPIHARLARAAVEAADGAWKLTCVASLADARAVDTTPDLVLLDLSLPDSQGLDTLARARERFGALPVVLLSATDDPTIEEQALAAGAQDFLGKDELTPRALRRVIRYAVERHRVQQDLVLLSTRDELTGLYNRRGFFAAAERLAPGPGHPGQEIVVLCADLDGLKHINDTLGHGAGDQAIQDAAWVLRHAFRSADIIARLGGDEFAVVATGAGLGSVPVLLERIEAWRTRRNAEPGRSFSVSLSVGAAFAEAERGASLEELLAAADAAAYRRKRARRAAR